ncbi:MAG: 3-methyl-2-oxobutanoate hydroxymethyltransferase [Candidatus Promineifilaceae bacterium]|nr:3-methyl-2-oxobutanoate hydroxymethyltransferase [Chloroflexota bacterium]MBK7177712.1 3-methyl-2-oxobutanoate hydroxymethyltransferase [Chloroflexota bacterium]MBP7591528.1 3-methyl-2-oxobutanoate hydroxymethyltransferase [Chloroflexota bacterium]
MSAQTEQVRQKVTIPTLVTKKQQGSPITMLTAYDYSSALLVDKAGMDIILVGDSLAMVMMGLDSTNPVTMEVMLHHGRMVARGAKQAFLVGDMPFMSFQVSVEEAVRNAGRFLQEGGMEAVKLEGGRAMADRVRAITQAGIPVMGHIGLTPQSVSSLGGYKVQGKTAVAAYTLLQDALALQEAGCFSLVLEAVPAPVAAEISRRLAIPTLGIGAGAGCDGQVLVYHDLLGLFDKFQPKFVKQYANIGEQILRALDQYRQEVTEKTFPAESHTFAMPDEELAQFLILVEQEIN